MSSQWEKMNCTFCQSSGVFGEIMEEFKLAFWVAVAIGFFFFIISLQEKSKRLKLEKEMEQPVEIWVQMRGEFARYAARFHVPKNSANGYLHPPKESAQRELRLIEHTPYVYLSAPEYRKIPSEANSRWKEVLMCGEVYRVLLKTGT